MNASKTMSLYATLVGSLKHDLLNIFFIEIFSRRERRLFGEKVTVGFLKWDRILWL